MYPRLNLDAVKLMDNIYTLDSKLRNEDIEMFAVTKVFLSDPKIVEYYMRMGVFYIADSRILNLKKLYELPCFKVLLRSPMASEVADVIKYSDISFNTEVETIKLLNEEAKKQDKTHKIMLMIDFGDLREGYFGYEATRNAIKEIINLSNIEIYGLGTNHKCYAGVIPDAHVMDLLIGYAIKLESEFRIKFTFLSGGNSSTLYMLGTGAFQGINSLRIGEAIITGKELAYENHIEGMEEDVFYLEAQIVELKTKPSKPLGRLGNTAFGYMAEFVDRGKRKRAILALGKLDLPTESITPFDEKAIILGASSDHTIIDVHDCDVDYKVGDIMKFHLTYSGVLLASSSDYVHKNIIDLKV